MRTGGPNIYICTGGGEYTKNPWRNTIMEKAYYTSNIPLKLMVDQEH
jgi:hypothetical protein